jgi:hypothetical protein
MTQGRIGRRPEEQLILASAAVEARRRELLSQERLDELTAALDWERLTNELRSRRLLATLGPRVVESFGERTEPRFVLALEEALQNGRHQGAFLQMIATRAIGELADRQIASVPLKGPQLSEVLYGDPARRPSSDIDLLVSADRLHDAVRVVREMGYEAPVDAVDDRGLPLLHFALAHEHDQLPPIELHWRIHWYEERFARERLLRSVAEHDDARARLGGLDCLLALLIFYARDGFVDLRLASDIGAWWDAFGTSVESEEFERTIRSYPRLERALVASAHAAHDVVGLPIEWLVGRARRLDARTRIAVRMANPNPHASQAQLYADMGLVDGLLTPPGGLRTFVARQVMPSRERIRSNPEGSEWRASSRVMHGLRVLGRYGMALARVLVGVKPVELN